MSEHTIEQFRNWLTAQAVAAGDIADADPSANPKARSKAMALLESIEEARALLWCFEQDSAVLEGGRHDLRP